MGDYLKVLDIEHSGGPRIGLLGDDPTHTVRVHGESSGLYQTLQDCARRHQDHLAHLRHLPGPTHTLPALRQETRLRPPAMPDNPLLTHVSGLPLGARDDAGWFYKGNGRVLHIDRDDLEVPYHVQAIAADACLVSIYLVGSRGQLLHVGVTLGHDLHDPLQGQSARAHLLECAVASELLLGELDEPLHLRQRIERNGTCFSETHLHLDPQAWRASREAGEALLEQHPQFLQPGMVHYLFSRLDSEIVATHLQHGDCLELSCPMLDMRLENRIVEEELRHLLPLSSRRRTGQGRAA
ncbi:fumarylacetoacetate hydrolase [Metapseudomonas otitidis]|uniref:fumarylacetoacetate hydrolase n=1 Tax=Metapseudomonas otitidis TaxID=319939 RepID=UPI001F2A0BBB|nr:fumarylacetoacetate hydrolase [Pseudomonas otitidis]